MVASPGPGTNPLLSEERDPLNLLVARLPRIGTIRSGILAEEGVRSVGDLLRRVPRRYIDRSSIPPINRLRATDDEITIIGRVIGVRTFPGKRKRTTVTISDSTGRMECVWFGDAGWIHRVFAPGDVIAVSGKLKRFRGWQMTHPDFELVGDTADDLTHMGRIIAVYPQTTALTESGLHSRGMRSLIRRTLEWLGDGIRDPLPRHILESQGFPPMHDALLQVHFPEDFQQAARARRRLVFEEFLGLELALAQRKHALAAQQTGIEFPEVGDTFTRILDRLPFELTNSQKTVLREIRRDMRSGRSMSRLLQGDVGSGKTLVAVLCAVMAADNGHQTAIMAPTEVLAEQHALIIGRMLFEVGSDCVLITGSTPAAQRRRALTEVATGQVPVVIGTHALLGQDVEFHDLGLVVVDEQHRFGVLQREALRGKSERTPDLLVMTATPIPRSLAQTLYGDLDVSYMTEKPAGRVPIRTIALRMDDEEQGWAAVREAVQRGERAYIVFPLVEESGGIDLRAATTGFEHLRTGPLFECRLALLHGRMNTSERDQVMQAFKAGRSNVLVTTTVIEVGVDVPEATVMVIQGAERFGLSQLHQLRGRIGRSDQPSTCYLVPGSGELTEEAERRIAAMVESDDGFRLAEVDLEIRGPGEFFGTKQSGLPEFRLANVVKDADVLSAARDEAFAIVEYDPELSQTDHRPLRRLAEPFRKALEDARPVA
jgi:ATP-dependent DNA helicase RecG